MKNGDGLVWLEVAKIWLIEDDIVEDFLEAELHKVFWWKKK